MMTFFDTLRERNEALFWFGALNFILALLFILLSRWQDLQVAGANAWYKPVKFALSIGIFCWTMGWYGAYLGTARELGWYNFLLIGCLGFEIIYIAVQAGRGQASHFNISTPVYAGLYNLMAAAATAVSLGTAYIGWLFFRRDFPELPDYYLWAIRLGILLFVVFSLEGFVMGSRLSHTIGGPDGGPGLPFLNWSRRFGDGRVAHFIGMHALQVLPLLSWYLLRDLRLTLAAALLYGLLALGVLVQALGGNAFRVWSGG